MMISPKKLIKMARKWQRIAAIRPKRISLPGTSGVVDNKNTVTEKGHFVVYSVDCKRFVLPIAYLNSYIFRELLLLSEDEFGLPGNGPIIFPCDSVFMDYMTNLIRHHASEDVEKSLLMSMANNRCSLSSSLDQHETRTQLLPCVF